jgi:hypothetical protein
MLVDWQGRGIARTRHNDWMPVLERGFKNFLSVQNCQIDEMDVKRCVITVTDEMPDM